MTTNDRKLPHSHVPYTDKYFIRTDEILKKEEINPQISMKVFCRGEGTVAGIEEAVDVLTHFSDLEETGGQIWVTTKERFFGNEPLMIIKGPVQSIVQLETMYLGVLSNAISLAEGITAPTPKEVTAKVKKLKDIYMDIPIIYFGARHYHWSLDKEIAGAALKGGATQTSTDAGSSNIGQKGVGTTPHLLTIILSSIFGPEEATLKTAQLFDKHIPLEIPRVTLVDTFNREITDTLAVARYFGIRKNSFRLDTCGENIGESCTPYNGEESTDPNFVTGTGVTIELATKVRNALIENDLANNTELFLTSGFGNEEKARAFVKANNKYKEETGFSLFSGVGIGEISNGFFCTADVFEVGGQPYTKTGREVKDIDYGTLKRIV